MNECVLKYYKIYNDVSDLQYATDGSACFDLRAYFGPQSRQFKMYDENNSEMNHLAYQINPSDSVHTIIKPKCRALIPTGIIFDIPSGYSVRVHIRSSVAVKKGLVLANSEGVVDSDYINELLIPVYNYSNTLVKIEHNERIAQAEIVQSVNSRLMLTIDKPVQKTNRVGGLGSTGIQ